MDFREFDAYKRDVMDFKPDYLFHLGAYTDLEFCEENADDTYVTNTLGVENAVYLANGLDIPLLYISVRQVFLTEKKIYTMIGISQILLVFMPVQNIWENGL